MQNEIFFRFGSMVYKMRWLILLAWLVTVFACLPAIPHAVNIFKTTGFNVDNSESYKMEKFINKKFGYGENKFIVLYDSKNLKTTDPAFMNKIKQSLSGIKNFKIKNEIIYPDNNKNQISKDKHTAYAVILLKQVNPINETELKKLKSLIKKPSNMNIHIGGELIFIDSINTQTQTDLFKADLIAAPVTIIMMIIIFESILAAMVPILIGAGCSLMILTILYLIGSHFTLSIYTLNIALLLGLCLSLDYALFIISRFRYELRNHKEAREAVAITQATAGKAVFFSGLAVFISLTPLLFFPINILFSIGVGGISAVFVAVMTANIVLPAMLGVLNKRVNFLSIKLLTPVENGRSRFWHYLVTKVVKHPVLFFITILIVLLTLSYPVTQVKFGISDYKTLPPHSASRLFFDKFNLKFGESTLTPIQLVVETSGSILSENNLKKLSVFTSKIKNNPSVKKVESIVNTEPKLTAAQYHALYTLSSDKMDKNIKVLLNTTTKKQLTLVSVISKYPANAVGSKLLVKDLQKLALPYGMSSKMSGVTLQNMDVIHTIKTYSPYAILFILGVTYFILLILLRSLFLPLKAIITTILSLCASYGILTFIIQEGHFSGILNFETQRMLDISLLIIIFCALFGFSMDYEVFLLTRIKEHYDKTGHTIKSIIFGVEYSSRIITSAAIIVLVICSSFMVADVLMVKAFGLGIAVAIFTDAFLIRTLLVPATMVLMGKWNWYLPKMKKTGDLT